ncbi:MAG: metalloregulator ArsR/SmtB family transcription factor [Deltaproteobacteria bacterium]|nr:metalloregulator ArsR/SmtB family transcription factor [Deltaproteobacteria bacterium]MBI3388054.1 metalloregulator ArsR/SmtB family transcription factor [Deltaproteobacteria bacterium]
MSSATPDIIGWMNALADATRARTLRLVEQYELTVADLCAVLQLPQSTVSRHLKLLADEGWVSARPEGTSRLYRMDVDDLEPAARRLWNLLREQTASTRVAAHDAQRLATILSARQTRSQAFFSSAAGQWDHLRREMFGDRFDLTALAGLLEDTWVLGDLGCGTGQVSVAVAPFVRQVIAVDSSRAMLKAARQRLGMFPHVDIRHGDLEALPIDDATLDAAVTCLVLHHVADPPAVLRAAARTLRPGGRLLVIDMLAHERREYQQQMGHVWLGFEPAQISDWLRDSGFERTRVQPLPPAPQAKGPALFAASARRVPRNGHSKQRRIHDE